MTFPFSSDFELLGDSLSKFRHYLEINCIQLVDPRLSIYRLSELAATKPSEFVRAPLLGDVLSGGCGADTLFGLRSMRIHFLFGGSADVARRRNQ